MSTVPPDTGRYTTARSGSLSIFAERAVAPVLARETGAGGWVSIRLSTPMHARYVVIWFTRLPPDHPGTFQASVFDVSLQGWP
jgi:hypothetical protein